MGGETRISAGWHPQGRARRGAHLQCGHSLLPGGICMKRWIPWFAVIVCAALAAPALKADVKTREKSTLKFEGLVGAFINRMAGGSDGLTSTVAVKGNRMSRTMENSGQEQIVDLSEEKVYAVDTKKKEYTVVTFAEMRQQMEQAREEMAKQSKDASPEDKQAAQDAAKQIAFEVDVKETGQHKPLLGTDAKEVVMTITMHQQGEKLDEGGGMVMTNTMWIAPKIAALDEVNAFNMKYYQAIFGGTFAAIDPAQVNAISALLPSFAALGNRMSAESRKLEGTPLAMTSVIEGVKSQEQMKESADASPSKNGGLGGMIANRLVHRQTQQRTTALTMTHETLSIAPAASTEDVSLPAGFKEKKK
jgi:hypothetical protein